jgi:hypothetical protein
MVKMPIVVFCLVSPYGLQEDADDFLRNVGNCLHGHYHLQSNHAFPVLTAISEIKAVSAICILNLHLTY